MHKIMFVCHGNICRSPMAEMIFKNIVRTNHRENEFIINSTATSREEIGNSLYPSAINILNLYNIPIDKHVARQITMDDYNDYDYIICMDDNNLRNISRIIYDDKENKIYKLLDFCDDYEIYDKDIEDPWYTDNFEKVYKEITDGCNALFNKLINERI